MGLINIEDVEYSCDICGKSQKQSDMVDVSNSTKNEIFIADIKRLSVNKYEPNVRSFTDGIRSTHRRYNTTITESKRMVLCSDCINEFKHRTERTITIENHSIKHMHKRQTTKSPIKLRDYSGRICDFVEDLLDKYNITIPDDAREGDPDEARLFGDNYCELEDNIVNMLEGLVEEIKANPSAEIDKDNL